MIFYADFINFYGKSAPFFAERLRVCLYSIGFKFLSDKSRMGALCVKAPEEM